MFFCFGLLPFAVVTPRAGVWIEIALYAISGGDLLVTPRAGVWIEMFFCFGLLPFAVSLPVRECGLKSWRVQGRGGIKMSLPVRECGLKFCSNLRPIWAERVTPRAGVWIEIRISSHFPNTCASHSPCGSVD